MELPPPTPPNDPVQPGATGSARQGTATPALRVYPTPPPFMQRFIMLCLRPESWAEAARYPTSATILPLMLAILVGAAAIAAGGTMRFISSMESFAAQYDARGYPPLTLHPDGRLTAEGPLATPIRAELRGVPLMPDSELLVLADPTGATSPDSVNHQGYFITDKQVVTTGEGPKWRFELKDVLPLYGIELPAAGQTVTLNGTSLSTMAAERRPVFIFFGILLAGVYTALQSIWSIFMIFVFSPLVVLVAAGMRHDESPQRRLLLPRRAAFRIIAGLLVPIVLADSLLRAVDRGIARVVGMEWTLLVWLLICGALAFWAGLMARKMYQPREQPRRAS